MVDKHIVAVSLHMRVSVVCFILAHSRDHNLIQLAVKASAAWQLVDMDRYSGHVEFVDGIG